MTAWGTESSFYRLREFDEAVARGLSSQIRGRTLNARIVCLKHTDIFGRRPVKRHRVRDEVLISQLTRKYKRLVSSQIDVALPLLGCPQASLTNRRGLRPT